MQEGAKRRDAGTGADHDDGHGRIGRQHEVRRLLDVAFDRLSGPHSLAEKGRGNAEPGAAAHPIAHGVDAERYALPRDLGRRRDGKEPRLHGIERLDESFQVGTQPAKFFQRRQHVKAGGVAVWILAGGERLCLLPPLAAGDIGEQLKQRVRREPERNLLDQGTA